MPSLQCLISTLTQAGGGGLLLRFAGSVQSWGGEAGALQADVAVCGERSPCSGHTGPTPAHGCLCFPVYTDQAPGCSVWSGPCAECGSSFRILHKSAGLVAPAFCVFPGLSGPGSQRLGALSTGAPLLFPPRPQRAPPVGSQGVFRQDPGPVCRVGGGGFSGAEFAPFPSPASYLQRGWGGSSLEFLSPFVLRTAGGVFRPVNFSSLSHSLKKSPSDCSQGLLAGPYPKECRRPLSVPPPLAGGGRGRLGYFSVGSCF